MKRGLSVWLFSKVVMFIFLFLTFAAVLSFMKVVSDRTTADSAEVLAMQITEAVQTSMVTHSISSEIAVPLPYTLPEAASVGTMKRYYTMDISERLPGVLSVAIGWGKDPLTYVAASSVQLSGVTYQNTGDLSVFSQEYSYILINRSESSLCIQKCIEISPPECDLCT